jgi:hypothetical protein
MLAGVAAAPRARARGLDRQRLGTAVGFALGVGALMLATWLYQGYQYEVWPQPGFLSYVLNFSGELQNDWFTSLPAAHWAIDHLLALVPHGKLDEAVLGLWLVFLAVVWASFLSICRSLGAPVYAGVAAGLVLILTRIGGFGVSEVLFEFFYPNTLSFAIAVGAVALILLRRYALAGAALGLSVMVHPGLGPLAVGAIAPAALFAEGRPTRRHVLRFGVPLVAIAALPTIQLLADQLAGGTLTPQERFDFLTVVREPHHILYSAFTDLEYVRTFLWAAVLGVSLFLLRRVPEVRPVVWVTGTIVLACVLGATASAIGWPLLFVTAQTSRLSALAVLLAVAAAAAALSRVDSRVATVSLAGTFLLAPLFYDRLFAQAGRLLEYVSTSALAALFVLGALVVATAARGPLRRRGQVPATAVVAGLALAGAGASLLAERADRKPVQPPLAVAWKQIAEVANGEVPPGGTVLTPPDQDGFSMYSERASVVEFGSIRLGEGEDEWRRRMLDVTGNPDVLEPDSVGTDVVARLQLLADSYDRQVTTSTLPICRYGVDAVVTRGGTPIPDWLTDIYYNGAYTLSTVNPGTCD